MENKVTDQTVEENIIALRKKAQSSKFNDLKALINHIFNANSSYKAEDKGAWNSYITLINEIIQHTLDIEASQQFLKENPLLGWVRKPGDAYVYKNVDLNETIKSIRDIFNSLSESVNTDAGQITPADNLKILHEIKKLSSKLPDSKYKDTLNTFWYAFMVFSIGMAAFICPPLIPFAIPVIGFMTSLNFMVGSIAMGMACHFGLKSFFDHAHHEEYKKTELETLELINSKLYITNLISYLEEPNINQIKSIFETAYREIEKEKETSPIKASQALKKINTLLQDDFNINALSEEEIEKKLKDM